MPRVPAPGSGSGLPRISTRVYQLVDQGYDAFHAVVFAFSEWLALVVAYYGDALTIDVGDIS